MFKSIHTFCVFQTAAAAPAHWAGTAAAAASQWRWAQQVSVINIIQMDYREVGLLVKYVYILIYVCAHILSVEVV